MGWRFWEEARGVREGGVLVIVVAEEVFDSLSGDFGLADGF